MKDADIIKKIKDWFAMYPPPYADSAGWVKFNKECKEKYPIRYWIDETLIPNTWWPITRFFTNIRDQIRWRLFEKFHVINTKLKPNYYDADSRMLHGMFSILVDFVEIEKAWMQAIFCEDYKKPWYPFKRFRDRDRGIKYLDWEINDPKVPDHQKESAEVIKGLYLWWTEDRPARLDPYSLYEDIPITKNIFEFFEESEKNPKRKQIHEQVNDLEIMYDNEDTEMLKKLIDVRGSLWT